MGDEAATSVVPCCMAIPASTFGARGVGTGIGCDTATSRGLVMAVDERCTCTGVAVVCAEHAKSTQDEKARRFM